MTALKQQDAAARRSDDEQRFALHFGTIDGSFGTVIPVSEQVYVIRWMKWIARQPMYAKSLSNIPRHLTLYICHVFFICFPTYSYWRLAALRSVMGNAIESHCALSTRAWRLYRRSFRRGCCQSNERMKGVLDGDLLLQFLDLSLVQQEELASAIGSTVDLILDSLLELECSSIPN